MKKAMCILLAAVLLIVSGAAAAEEVRQPDGGEKFASNWALQGMMVEIVYEAEAYQVMIRVEDLDKLEGIEWYYSCDYHEDEDALVSVCSEKCEYVIDEEDLDDRRYNVPEYEGPDGEGLNSRFTIDGDGRLVWEDAREDRGRGLAFVNIGAFSGAWQTELEEVVYADIFWYMHNEAGSYTVWVQRFTGDEMDDYEIWELDGVYNPETGKLECAGTVTLFTLNADGEYERGEGEEAETFFSMAEDGRILFGIGDGIELEPDYADHG